MRLTTSCLSPTDVRQLLLGSLSKTDEAAALAHLEQCPRCRSRLESDAAGDANFVSQLEASLQRHEPAGSDMHMVVERFVSVMRDQERSPQPDRLTGAAGDNVQRTTATRSAAGTSQSAPDQAVPDRPAPNRSAVRKNQSPSTSRWWQRSRIARLIPAGLVPVLLGVCWFLGTRPDQPPASAVPPAIRPPDVPSETLKTGALGERGRITVRPVDGAERQFAGLNEALEQIAHNCEILLNDAGPHRLSGDIDLAADLTIKSATPGTQAIVLINEPSDSSRARPGGWRVRKTLTLEHLELRQTSPGAVGLDVEGGVLRATNCRFISQDSLALRVRASGRIVLNDCEVHAGRGTALHVDGRAEQVTLFRTLTTGRTLLMISDQRPRMGELQLHIQQSQLCGAVPLQLTPSTGPQRATPVRMLLERSVIAGPQQFIRMTLANGTSLPGSGILDVLPGYLHSTELDTTFVTLDRNRASAVDDPALSFESFIASREGLPSDRSSTRHRRAASSDSTLRLRLHDQPESLRRSDFEWLVETAND